MDRETRASIRIEFLKMAIKLAEYENNPSFNRVMEIFNKLIGDPTLVGVESFNLI